MPVLKYRDPTTGEYVPLSIGIVGGRSLAPSIPAQNGSLIISGIGPPTADVGKETDFYLDGLNHVLYGPKTIGIWPVALAGGTASLRFTFATALDDWVIDHNLGTKAIKVSCFDLTETDQYDPEVDFISENQVVAHWYYPTSGIAIIIG